MRGLHGTSLSISQSAGGGEGDIAQYTGQIVPVCIHHIVFIHTVYVYVCICSYALQYAHCYKNKSRERWLDGEFSTKFSW